MRNRIITPEQFAKRVKLILNANYSKNHCKYDYVTGPGRSGAIAAVYVSYYLKIPFVPFLQFIPNKNPLIVDTARQSGRTLRKASSRYSNADIIAFYEEPPRIKFWYEMEIQ